MENCKKHSKLLCSECRHYDYCDIAKRCDGVCYKCDITDCQNHKKQKTIKAEKEIVIMSQTTGECIHLSLNNYKNWNEIEPDLEKRLSNPTDIEEEKISIVEITGFKLSEKDRFCDKPRTLPFLPEILYQATANTYSKIVGTSALFVTID